MNGSIEHPEEEELGEAFGILLNWSSGNTGSPVKRRSASSQCSAEVAARGPQLQHTCIVTSPYDENMPSFMQFTLKVVDKMILVYRYCHSRKPNEHGNMQSDACKTTFHCTTEGRKKKPRNLTIEGVTFF